jgi:RimJ/RimL family protein N-acetyltransferase
MMTNDPPKHSIICKTPRLILTPWQAGDAAMVAALHSTPETSQFVSTGAPWSVDYAAKRIEGWMTEYKNHGTGKLKLLSKEDGRFIGRAGFSWSEETASFELGYSIMQKEWGRGFATEIAAALRQWFFAAMPHDRFIAFAHVDNAASQAVLRKAGMNETERRDYKGRPFQFFESLRPR